MYVLGEVKRKGIARRTGATPVVAAHRLLAITTSDKFLVLDLGEWVEFDPSGASRDGRRGCLRVLALSL